MPKHATFLRHPDADAPAADPQALLATSRRLWAAYRQTRDPALLRRIAALDALIPATLAEEEGEIP
jgi:hypothetical protein